MELIHMTWSAHDIIRKHVAIPNCLTMASISYKNCLQYADIPLTELID